MGSRENAIHRAPVEHRLPLWGPLTAPRVFPMWYLVISGPKKSVFLFPVICCTIGKVS